MSNQYKLLILFSFAFACTEKSKVPEVSNPPTLINTETRPTNKQWKGIWAFQESSVFFTNDFPGARLNGVVRDSTDHFMALITAENYPINPSPWYAFKVWSEEPKEITIQLTYTNSRSRYYPKISNDGKQFQPVDSSRVKGFYSTGWGIESVPESIEMTLAIGKEPTWIAAQELWTSIEVKEWMDLMALSQDVSQEVIGQSREKRPIPMLKIGNQSSKKGMLIISRQHPPEVTGFLAMKSFIETIASESELAQKFKENHVVYNVPLVNPDGVDNGHWRHNTGGIDLNRDWQAFNQPETSAVRDFLVETQNEGVDFVFAADFHSTWQDIYYPLDSSIVKGNELFIYEWIHRIVDRLGVQNPNIKPSIHLKPTMVSRNHFYHAYGIPSIVFELGDNTQREFLARKGEVAAEELMKILLNQSN